MSLLPYFIVDILPVAQNFHPCVAPADLWSKPNDCTFMSPAGYLRSALSNLNEFEKQVQIDKDGFQVNLDVQHFQPNEISVKTIDNSIIVEGNHEERKDEHGFISRKFTRRYDLPEGFKPKDVVSTISSDGILSIKCPKSEPAIEGNVRHVQIQQTGPARLNVSNQKEKEAVKEQPK